MKLIAGTLLTLTSLTLMQGCKNEPDDTTETRLIVQFQHNVDGNPLVTDSMMYINPAGNEYEVSELMYFISNLRLYHHDGRIIEPDGEKNIHYTDISMPETNEWIIGNDIPAGSYDSITFTFGIREQDNISNMFVNPPEVNMAWPEVLGGGYHYMMMNGWWKDLTGTRKPFNFHLGIGQIYANNSGDPDDITGFVHNAFTVKPEGGSFTVTKGKTHTGILVMNIESWFDTPVVYDHNHFGGAVMQNQEAMHTICLNGADVFSLTWE